MTAMATVQKRTAKRSRVYLLALLKSDGGFIETRVRDISQSGALLEAQAAPPVGSEVELVCGGTKAKARVAWVDRTWFGIEFDQPLTSPFLIDQTGAKLKVSAPRSYRRDSLQDR